MRYIVKTDQYKRKKSIRAEQKRRFLKYFQSDNKFFKRKEAIIFDEYFERFAKNASVHRINSRCLLTRRSKGVFKFFSLERRVLRYLVANACFTGIRRAFW